MLLSLTALYLLENNVVRLLTMSATGKQPNTSWQYLMSSLEFIIKKFPVATIYDKLQGINLGASKWTNIRMERYLELNNCINTSAEAARPTLPNIALNAL